MIKLYIMIDSNNIIQAMLKGHPGGMVLTSEHIEVPLNELQNITLGVSKYINGTVVNA